MTPFLPLSNLAWVCLIFFSIGVEFQRQYVSEEFLTSAISYAQSTNNTSETWRLRHLLATLQGRYDFPGASLEQLTHDPPKQFVDWLVAAWSAP